MFVIIEGAKRSKSKATKVHFQEKPQFFFDHYILMLKDEIFYNQGDNYNEKGRNIQHLMLSRDQTIFLAMDRAYQYFTAKLHEDID